MGGKVKQRTKGNTKVSKKRITCPFRFEFSTNSNEHDLDFYGQMAYFIFGCLYMFC